MENLSRKLGSIKKFNNILEDTCYEAGNSFMAVTVDWTARNLELKNKSIK